MSTLAYAQLTNKRDAAAPGTSDTVSPGVQSYVDAVAALVPAEVLTLHALIISYTTETGADHVTKIVDGATLSWSFWALMLLSAAIYFSPRFLARQLDRWDSIRILIPPFAFVAWTMLQRTTAFDAVFPGVLSSQRTVAALFLAVILGGFASALAYKADQKQP
jgi:hypothetical protein